MDGKEKKGFWGSLLRTRSLARKGKVTRLGPINGGPRRASDGDAGILRDTGAAEQASPTADSQQATAETPAKQPNVRPPGKVSFKPQSKTPPKPSSRRRVKRFVEDEVNSGGSESPRTPLTEWPPSGMRSTEELPLEVAHDLIARGAPSHKGHKRAVPHAPDDYFALYVTTTGTREGDGTDGANLQDTMTTLMTLRLHAKGRAENPWETLEQPSYAAYWGRLRGTITLNQWATASSVLPPSIALRDSGVVPRPMGLARILERMQELQAGLEDDDEDLLYRILYKRILRDPERVRNPHRTLDKQITDLILVLSRPDWIDFTNPRNQVVTRFIFDATSSAAAGMNGVDRDEEAATAIATRYHKFFHQLLLSMELEARIMSRQHGDWAKQKLLRQIPPTIQWNLALARRWREHVRVDGFGNTPADTQLRYKLKKRQVKQLRRFAQLMKWPNLLHTLDNLRQKDENFLLDSISSDAFAYFSGLVLPGATFPFLIMNTLIDLDPDPATDDLALLSHMHPSCGFQYRNSYTYWSASCIVGKVLAPTCRSIGGWVGPGRPTADLGRSQIARIRSRRPRQQQSRRGDGVQAQMQLAPEDVLSIGERSDALGPPAKCYPVREYELVTCDPEDTIDTVRLELLKLQPVEKPDEAPSAAKALTLRLFDATLLFAIDGVSWPLRLAHDVSFISAYPCSLGPHPLFFDYIYETLRVDELLGVQDWGAGSVLGGLTSDRESRVRDAEDEVEKVLVVEAFGVGDCEVLARAWCSHWGLSGVVADVRKTCVACAIREAYAATLTVVILVDGQRDDYDDDYE